ncbi:MAG: ParB/RepB/Spo0J family partition protein [Proteobacteria bacterium]|uniref:ParB/RepB/Spo0J family partition protein n=1 Tax=Rudaea sp. TaxID=2136325 RepID=UPI001D408199|nr:ParB/RepB/Spo0J family partition protein [Pseudomonadota bacterium]MBS0568064.1 ParB/RepB/Spo0J family partition protein [Pseudomonadota bacterium]
MAAAKRRGLGSRDLDVLLGGGDVAAETAAHGDDLRALPVGRIAPGKYQPRRVFDQDKLAELAASIKAQGVIQPIVVRPLGAERYEIIAGERRWRAAQLAGLAEVPVVVREVGDPAVAAMTLIENIQREDLSALEEAHALRRLIDEFQHTHEKVAEAIGRSRSAVSNLLRLLDLPEEIQRLLKEGRIETGHAKALATLPAALALGLARHAAAHGWSVRELEAAARKAQTAPQGKAKKAASRDADIVALERELSEKLAARVAVQHGSGGRGKLVIGYHSLDELEGILEKIRR